MLVQADGAAAHRISEACRDARYVTNADVAGTADARIGSSK